ncbi:uncharacterized protein LOC119330408 isoform X2 [Triticum dicoccoides]|uniref:uncharacterized protein LOC119330408 isoform X2 n=1 Tax=Triticum dicoccoides TaxID=85692 RepID=UPI00189138A7|nr:uncharacterized protein LOC119330408 isoform X2 [Triticum dicoccoides]
MDDHEDLRVMCCCSGPSLCFSSLVRVQLLRGHSVFRVALPSRPPRLLCLVYHGSQWGLEGLRLEVPARQLTDALNGSDFLKEKEVPKGDGSNKSESKIRRHKSWVLNYVKAMLMCKSLRVTSSMSIIFPPTSFRPWRPATNTTRCHGKPGKIILDQPQQLDGGLTWH